MPFTFHLDIVSAEEEIFSGTVDMLVATGDLGELGISPGHAPLLTSLKPGPVKVTKHGGEEEFYYVSGGMLEVQPHVVTILADTAVRAHDVDEAAAEDARRQAEQALKDQTAEIEYSKAAAELAEAVAQLRTLQAIRKKAGK
ncbi:F0F1 ATP synthase subunit epsilon [Pleionea sp. CnH1-48]|uniref:F0F1 ATP synthase subunit epsilon n=1 Tax=Pleionea sp. CnH1-48 TaxID=2954494 RepID=UPI0020976D02|nr:F0F1 ATP synthase subunit epsilon [Pleionea sp. CnH1-48]MCO7226600.1 F0F1 ATP synthase subunit epsilon [Pleionea sp. CnH1-48]